MANVKIPSGVECIEYGYVIKPFHRPTVADRVKYPFKNTFSIPKGYQLSGAKSQNDPVRYNTYDDVIRIYALVPYNEKELTEVDIYVVPTGEVFTADVPLTKLTIVKEAQGEYIWHIYYKSD